MIAQGAVGVIEVEDPASSSVRRQPAISSEQRQSSGQEHFARVQVFERAGDFGGLDFGDAELAGGDVDVRDGRRASPFDARRPRDSCSRASAAGSHSVAVPGVTMRVISRFTSFLVSFGSSICSQMATR